MEKTLAYAFPSALRSASEAAISAFKLSAMQEGGYAKIKVFGENLLIPYRVQAPYFTLDRSDLTLQQQQIAKCLLTRSHDGFERQAALKEILSLNEPWSVPFVFMLIGEYVIEMIADIYAALPDLNHKVVADFLEENPDFYKITGDRVMSYWDCNYRHQFRREDYVGFKLMRALDAMVKA